MLLSVFARFLSSLAQLVSFVCVFCSIYAAAAAAGFNFPLPFSARICVFFPLKAFASSAGKRCVYVLKQKLITYTQGEARS